MKTDRSKAELHISEIKAYFINTWINANKLFTLMLERNKDMNSVIQPKYEHFDFIRTKYENSVEEYIYTTLGKYDSINYDTFRKWMEIDHTLELNYTGKSFRVAMSLTCLNDIELINDLK